MRAPSTLTQAAIQNLRFQAGRFRKEYKLHLTHVSRDESTSLSEHLFFHCDPARLPSLLSTFSSC